MARFKFHLTILSLFILALIFTGRQPAHSDSSASQAPRPVFDVTYRSRTAMHKVIVQANDAALRDEILAAGGAVIEDYGSFALMSAPDATAESVTTQSRDGSTVRDDMNVLLLRAHAFDTTTASEDAFSTSSLGPLEPADEQLYLVQMVGPVKKDWRHQLEGEAEIVSYIPNNGYLVRATADAFARLKQMQSGDRPFVQFAGLYKPEYRIAPEINLNADALVDVTVQIAGGKRIAGDIDDITAMSQSVIEPPQSALNYTNLRLQVSTRRLAEIARKSNVVWIEPWAKPVLHDEKQGMIVAALYNGNTLNPHGYLAWLASKGITASPDFSIDIADTGLDKGTLDPAEIHKDFLGAGGASRVVYSRYSSSDFSGTINDTLGHGTINASIAGGFNNQSGAPYTDADGYSLGLGIHPFARLGVSKIFDPEYLNPSLTQLIDQMYGAGARISNNSWGVYNNSYTTDSQNYDAMVRDARRNDAGNQELTIIFSAGNKGAGGHLTSPGNAKNTIMVGASENLRAGVDACGVDSSGADNINDIIDFSSGGPTTDGRIKPDIVAPGTHIQGARSQDRNYTAGGVCAGNYPPDQVTYTWSSGTSHAAPAVSGAAALLRQFFQQSVGHPPSPAMVKAYLTNAATYLTGYRAGDTLPSPSQGFGLLNIGRALDEVPRIMVDQDQVLANTGQVYTLKGRVVDPSKPLRITLAWTDAPGSPAASPVVNNLDLQVDVGGKTYLGNHFSGAVSIEGGSADTLNNLEAVYAPTGASGEFTVRVVAANLAGDGVPGNSDSTDQDFALVAYNAVVSDGSGGGGGGGGGGSVESPPTVNIKYPLGGEHITVGSFLRVLWDASDDKGIQSQRVEFSADGLTYNLIGAVDGKTRQFDWRVPAIPTPLARIRVTAQDGVNLPVSSTSPSPFEIVNGPPDNVPPTVLVVAPDKHTVVGGGQVMSVQWKESDNVGVVQRVIELSTDNGNTWTRILGISAPSSGVDQKYDWIVPIDMSTLKAQVRVTVYDGAGNSATAVSGGNFDVWPMPIITNVIYHDETPPFLEVSGRYFRNGETQIYAGGVSLGKIYWDDKFFDGQGMSHKVFSRDKKLFKRVPVKQNTDIVVMLPQTGQTSPPFTYQRPKN